MAQSVLINGVAYENVPSVVIPKSGGTGDATFYDCSVDDAVQADVLSGKTFHTSSGPKSGLMANNGAINGTITEQNYADGFTVPAGYHNGSGKVNISSTEKEKIIDANIKSGVTILGVNGSFTSDANATESDILSGKTAYVNGNKVTGTMTAASVSQDSTTKVLTIS